MRPTLNSRVFRDRQPLIAAASILGTLLPLVLAELPLGVYPAADRPAAVDVVMVFRPATKEQFAIAAGMLEAGLTDALVEDW